MILRAKFENILSFNSETEISFIAGKGTSLPAHVYRAEKRDDISVLDITRYYSMCERALVYDWCLNKGVYSLGKYSKKSMPVMMEHFKVNK